MCSKYGESVAKVCWQTKRTNRFSKPAKAYAMLEHFERYPWVLPIYHYSDIPGLLASIKEHIIKPVEEKANEKEKTKLLEQRIRELEDENRRLKGK